MSKQLFITCAVALVLGAGVTIGIEARGQESDRSRRDAEPAGTKVHFEGCVFPDAALHSPKPVIIVPATTQPFYLMNVKVIAGEIPDDQASKITYTPTHADADALRALYGKRVGVTGRVDAAAHATRPNLAVVDIREISGGCPTLPPGM